jgi:CRP/FNR family transcriptional regulator, cyclic AMP receptor protein
MPATEQRAASDSELLARLEFFRELSREQRQRIFAAMTVYEVPRGGAIFTNGQQLSDLFVLLSGAADLSCVAANGKRIKMALFSQGLITQLPALAHLSQFRCEAMRQSRVGRISRDDFIHILLGIRAPEFDHIAKLLFSRTGAFLTRHFVGLDLRARVAAALLELGAAFGARNSRGTMLTITLSQHDLADLAGASRPKVSMVLREFARNRAIYLEARHLVLVPTRLEEIGHFHHGVATR